MSRPVLAAKAAVPSSRVLCAVMLLLCLGACGESSSRLEPLAPPAGRASRHSLADRPGADSADGAARASGTEGGTTGASSADAWSGRIPLPDGSTLELPAPPRAVLPGSAGSVDMLVALLPPERLAGLPVGSERYSALRSADGPYLRLPTFAAFRAEQLLALSPDLVIAHSWQPAETVARLQDAGVAVLRLADGNSWDSVRTQLLLLGRILDVEGRASALVASCDRRVQALLRGQGPGPRPGALCYSNGGAGGWVAGAETTLDEVLRLAGLTNLAADQGRVGHGTMTFEGLLVADPEVLVVGGAADGQSPGGTAAFLRESSALSSLRAVREEHIAVLPSWLYTTTSQHMVDAAEQLASQVAPWIGSVGR